MPLETISEPEKPCLHLEHNPPMHLVLQPGTYKYTCPGCGQQTVFVIPLITCQNGGY